MASLYRASSSVFSHYLLAPFPFRRRKESTDSTDSADSAESVVPLDAASQPISIPSEYLRSHTSYIRCGHCAADLCFTSQIISKGFTGRHGRAYLVSASTSAHGHSTKGVPDLNPTLPNTHTHKVVPRQLVTGAHTVSDVSCSVCGSMLGWKYVDAEEESQRYKVGKFILETKKVCAGVSWDDAKDSNGGIPPLSGEDGEDVEFDSQDEDECEDLFAGVWSPSLALKRRRARKFDLDSLR
ncbi:hypothetical protein MMC19_000168 [Ptychographa xylographoides]|nr:hypothetical protein [Ptychographa xylographoides]